MSAARHDPAFPSHGSMGEVCHTGMTLRDYFAAEAMNGILAGSDDKSQMDSKLVAQAAYVWADRMLKARDA